MGSEQTGEWHHLKCGRELADATTRPRNRDKLARIHLILGVERINSSPLSPLAWRMQNNEEKQKIKIRR